MITRYIVKQLKHIIMVTRISTSDAPFSGAKWLVEIKGVSYCGKKFDSKEWCNTKQNALIYSNTYLKNVNEYNARHPEQYPVEIETWITNLKTGKTALYVELSTKK